MPIQQGYPNVGGASGPAYLSAVLFVVCALFSFVLASVTMGDVPVIEVDLAGVGMAFTMDFTGNRDFGISATITTGCVTLTAAALMFARLRFARWTLGSIGIVVSLYYLIALFVFTSQEAPIDLLMLMIVFGLLWITSTVFVFLPVTARALRR
ncbi:hypothetical protein [Stackebrandtia soli]|uniref:hypothetical protein n=1 Tax=Stackebrandtia soli TaxID=1892856 RepID=UPI0039E9ACCE